MTLTLVQVASLLHITPRQVRHLVQTGKLVGNKIEGRWVFDEKDLPLTEAQKQEQTNRTAELRDTVDAVLTRAAPIATSRGYTVWDLNVFRTACAEVGTCSQHFADSPATIALRRCVVRMAQGCHRYHDREKVDAYRDAREHLAEAVALLYCEPVAQAHDLARRLELEVMPGLAGLLRRQEKRNRT